MNAIWPISGPAILKSGASIAEMNCVRRHLSAVNGDGSLRRAIPPRRWGTQ